MPHEIELKLQFEPSALPQIQTFFDEYSTQISTTQQLSNRYFDTEELTLRHWDMGLRVRQIEQYREQTIKTKGTVVNGMHQRPEYNIKIDADFPTLSLFPANIWPRGAKIEALQHTLYCLFETNFQRQCWRLSVNNSQIEVALDQGQVSASHQNYTLDTPICELELELLSGDSKDLLKLAEQLGLSVKLTPSDISKAQRGYQLAAQVKTR